MANNATEINELGNNNAAEAAEAQAADTSAERTAGEQTDAPLSIEDIAGEEIAAIKAEDEAAEAAEEAVEEKAEAKTEEPKQAEEAEATKTEAPKAEVKEEKKAEPTGPTFETLDLPQKVVDAVSKVGYKEPSPIQAQTIPLLMSGQDVVGLAQTGTGKTAAFGLPILARIDREVRRPQALVLAPTRELALQVAESFQSFADHLGGISILPIYGGQSYGIQLGGLRRGAQIIVGTPGRVIDHLEKGSLDISDLRFLVLDEADEMLQMGFQEDVERILADTPDNKQVALFSATMPNGIRRLSKQYLNDPAEVTIKSQTRTAENIRQRFLMTAHRNKFDALTRVLEVEEFDGMIVFVRTKHETEELAEKLRGAGLNSAAINGDIPQTLRERTVDQLKDGRLDILVATDVAARGLDVERISHVVNFDIPNDTESYVHRIGRTGRAGRSGEALLFVTPREGRMLRSIERATKSELIEMKLPSVDEVNEARKTKFAESITKALDNKQMGIFRDLIQKYADDNEVELVDVAAALAAQAQTGPFYMKEQPRRERNDRQGGRNDRTERRGNDERRFREDRQGGRNRGTKQNRQAEAVDFSRDGMKQYRISVGRRQGVRPGAIVGAIANEGGLQSADFGHIDIRGDYTLVELPANMPGKVRENLSGTRISGQLIDLSDDTSAPEGAREDDRYERGGNRGGGREFRGGSRGGDRGGNRGGGRNFRGGRGGDRDRDGERGGDRGGRGGFNRDDRGGDRRGGGGRGRDDRGGYRGNRGGWDN